MPEAIKIRAIFVQAHSGTSKAGKPFHMLTLSNGIRSATSFLDAPINVEGLKEGDEVDVTITADINSRNEWDVKPVEIARAS